MSVTIHNLEQFVAAVVDATVGGGVARQAAALREGLQQVLSLTSLRLFNEEELHALVCGQAEAEAWTPDALLVRVTSLVTARHLHVLPSLRTHLERRKDAARGARGAALS